MSVSNLIPSFNMKKGAFRVPSLTLLSLVVFLLFYGNLVNIANYSFLSFTYSGGSISHPVLELIKYSRLPVMLIAILAFTIVIVRDKRLRTFCIRNLDLFLFLGLMIFGLSNSIDMVNGLFYTIWHCASFTAILLFLFYLGKSLNRINSVHYFIRFLFWSNFLVLPLLLLNVGTIGKYWTYHMAFSSKTFYPYCLLTMLLSIYSSKLLTNQSVFNFSIKKNAICEVVVSGLLILFCFISARRTPLIIMILVTIPYIYFKIGKRIWKKFAFILTIGLFLSVSIPLGIYYMENNKRELAILKKMSDLVTSGGDVSKDASYNERLLVWDSYIDVFQQYKFFGVGSFNGRLVQKRMFASSHIAGYSTHNLYLGILVEHGLLGFLMFLTIVTRSIMIMFLRMPVNFSNKYLFFLLLPVLLINWNEYNLIPGQVFYWTTVLVLLFPRIFLIKRSINNNLKRELSKC